MPAELKKKLEIEAEKRDRPLSVEILERLNKSLLDEDLNEVDTEDLLSALLKRFDSVELKLNKS